MTDSDCAAIGVGGIPGILSIQPQYMPTFALAMVAAIVVPFILTTLVGKKKGIDKQAEVAQAEAEANAAAEIANAEAEKNLESEHAFKAYLYGKVISLKEIGDGVFFRRYGRRRLSNYSFQ